MEVSLKSKIAPSFYPVHRAIKSGDYSQFWLAGGRGSTKSSFVPIEIILGIIQDKEANALCLRKVADTLRSSIFANLEWAIEQLGLTMFFDSTVSPMEFTYRPTGQKIILKGLDKAKKLKSIKVAKGYFKYLWFEELDEFNGMAEVRSVQQSVLRAGQKYIEFFTYNPPDDVYSWVNTEANRKPSNRYTHHSTYLDVDPLWLGSRFTEDAERLKQNDYDAYRHEYLGEVVGRTDKVIFNGKWEEREFEPSSNWDGAYYGADWGFANDPTVLARLWIHDDCIWIDYAHYGYRVDIDATPELFDFVPNARQSVIRADSARPETISYMNNHGYEFVKAAAKWTGSVEDGISFLRSYRKIYIHPRCKELIEEAKNYSYKVNRAGDVTAAIEDKFNHGWDAVRYALEPLISSRRLGFTPAMQEEINIEDDIPKEELLW